jgi:hypothetical protein
MEPHVPHIGIRSEWTAKARTVSNQLDEEWFSKSFLSYWVETNISQNNANHLAYTTVPLLTQNFSEMPKNTKKFQQHQN